MGRDGPTVRLRASQIELIKRDAGKPDLPPGPDARTLWMGDVVGNMDEEYVRSLFSVWGTGYEDIEQIKVQRDPETGKAKGFAFIEFYSHAAAAEALSQYKGRDIPGTGRVYRLSWATFGLSDKRPTQEAKKPVLESPGAFLATLLKTASHIDAGQASYTAAQLRNPSLWASTQTHVEKAEQRIEELAAELARTNDPHEIERLGRLLKVQSQAHDNATTRAQGVSYQSQCEATEALEQQAEAVPSQPTTRSTTASPAVSAQVDMMAKLTKLVQDSTAGAKKLQEEAMAALTAATQAAAAKDPNAPQLAAAAQLKAQAAQQMASQTMTLQKQMQQMQELAAKAKMVQKRELDGDGQNDLAKRARP